MDELKKRLAEMCRKELDYYDIVHEHFEVVRYDRIIDFLFDRIAGMMKGDAEDGTAKD